MLHLPPFGGCGLVGTVGDFNEGRFERAEYMRYHGIAVRGRALMVEAIGGEQVAGRRLFQTKVHGLVRTQAGVFELDQQDLGAIEVIGYDRPQ